MVKNRSSENLETLKNLIQNDMTDESLMLDINIIEKEHEAELMQRDKIISEKDDMISKIQTENKNIISTKDAEIALLKAELETLKAQNNSPSSK